jgi:hypothetical protein
VSRRVDVVNTRGCDVYRWDVQRVWCDVVQQLQRRICVPCRLDVVNTSSSHVYRGELQCFWRDVVQQL